MVLGGIVITVIVCECLAKYKPLLLRRFVIWLVNLKERFLRIIARQQRPQINPRSTIHPVQPKPPSRLSRFLSRSQLPSAATTPAAPPTPRDLPLAGTSGSKRFPPAGTPGVSSKRLPPLDTPCDLPDTPRLFEQVPLPSILEPPEAGLTYRRGSLKFVNSNYCAC